MNEKSAIQIEMCQCTCPEYEVMRGKLHCSICFRPVSPNTWQPITKNEEESK